MLSVFGFGNTLVRRLSLAQKVLAVAGLFSVPIGVLFTSMNGKFEENIHFAQEEMTGVHLTSPLSNVLLLAGQHLGISQKVLASDAESKDTLAKLEETFKTKWDAFKAMTKKEGVSNKSTTELIAKVDERWQKLVAEGQSKSKNDNLNAHYDLLADLAQLSSNYADSSQLTLDPDLDSYYVMDAIVAHLPLISESMSRLSGIGVSILSSKSISEEDKIQIVLYKSLLKRDMAGFNEAIEKATAKNPTLKNELIKVTAPFKKEMDDIIAAIDADILSLDNDTIASIGADPKEFYAKFSKGQEISLQLSQQGFASLESLLKTRQNREEQERLHFILLISGILAFASYLFLCIRRAVGHDVMKLQQAASALSKGVFDQSAQTLGRDELWEINESMNTVRSAIERVVLDVDRLSEAGQSGNLQIRADASLHSGGYQSLVKGLNNTLDAVVKPLTAAAQHVAQLAEGNIPQPITESFQGDFQILRDNLNKATTAVNALVRDANGLVEQAVAGNLSYRANASTHQGDYRKIILGVNTTLDAVIEPMTLAIDYVDNLAKGHLLPPITKQYNGDFSRLTSSLNTAIASISRIVVDVNHLVSALSHGDLNSQADASLHQGEFAVIISSVNQALRTVADPIKAVGDVFEKLAEGDLRFTVDHQYEGQFDALASSANTTIEGLRDLVGKIAGSVDLIATGAREISSGNSDLSSRTEEQAASLEETAASLEELTGTVRQNAENARQANQLAMNAATVAEQGSASVSKVINTMEEINQSSKKISDIITVIDSIAFQTNILALNAAVEAARAGEQGRGFAVVASEVRSLAQRSANAAREIKTLISDSVQRVDAGAKIVNEAGSIMTEINTSVNRVTQIIADISSASVEQSEGIMQVNKAVAQMDQATQQNAALVEQAAAAAESMADQADGLDRLVAQFKLNQGKQSKAKILPSPSRKVHLLETNQDHILESY